jgi:hypothetical protein
MLCLSFWPNLRKQRFYLFGSFKNMITYKRFIKAQDLAISVVLRSTRATTPSLCDSAKLLGIGTVISIDLCCLAFVTNSVECKSGLGAITAHVNRSHIMPSLLSEYRYKSLGLGSVRTELPFSARTTRYAVRYQTTHNQDTPHNF